MAGDNAIVTASPDKSKRLDYPAVYDRDDRRMRS